MKPLDEIPVANADTNTLAIDHRLLLDRDPRCWTDLDMSSHVLSLLAVPLMPSYLDSEIDFPERPVTALLN